MQQKSSLSNCQNTLLKVTWMTFQALHFSNYQIPWTRSVILLMVRNSWCWLPCAFLRFPRAAAAVLTFCSLLLCLANSRELGTCCTHSHDAIRASNITTFCQTECNKVFQFHVLLAQKR